MSSQSSVTINLDVFSRFYVYFPRKSSKQNFLKAPHSIFDISLALSNPPDWTGARGKRSQQKNQTTSQKKFPFLHEKLFLLQLVVKRHSSANFASSKKLGKKINWKCLLEMLTICSSKYFGWSEKRQQNHPLMKTCLRNSQESGKVSSEFATFFVFPNDVNDMLRGYYRIAVIGVREIFFQMWK